MPSPGDVPLPNSSIKINEFGVAIPVEMSVSPFFRVSGAPKIIAEEAISFAKVLRLFSISSSLDKRVRSESCTLGAMRRISWDILRTDNVPETSVLGWNEASTHGHDGEKANLPQVGALP